MRQSSFCRATRPGIAQLGTISELVSQTKLRPIAQHHFFAAIRVKIRDQTLSILDPQTRAC